MNDLIYLEDNKIKVSDSAMQIQEFKDFKRYDRSEKNNFFDKAMAYIFFVYKVFGYDKENISPFANLPLNLNIVITKWHRFLEKDVQFKLGTLVDFSLSHFLPIFLLKNIPLI